jgi:hypothetical protein
MATVLKLNFKKGPPPVNVQPIKPWVAMLLCFSLLWQSGTWYQKHTIEQQKQAEIKSLSSQLQILREHKKSLATSDDLDSLNGAIYAQKEWIKQREKSPLFLLAKLEKERPGAVELRGFEADGGRGTIQMIAGDLDTASRYMNAVFGNTNVRIAMVDRVAHGILAGCTWTD